MLENSAEAEDLTQETFLTVFRRIHAFRGETSFSTWLHLVTVTVVLLHIHNKIVAETSREETRDRTEETQACGVELGDADLYLNNTMDRLGLQRAIDQLTPDSSRDLCSTTTKAMHTRRLPIGAGARRALQSRNCRKAGGSVNCLRKAKTTFARKNPLCQLLYLRVCARQSSPGRWQQGCSIQTQRDAAIGDLKSEIDDSSADAGAVFK